MSLLVNTRVSYNACFSPSQSHVSLPMNLSVALNARTPSGQSKTLSNREVLPERGESPKRPNRLLDPTIKVEMARWISAPRRLWWR